MGTNRLDQIGREQPNLARAEFPVRSMAAFDGGREKPSVENAQSSRVELLWGGTDEQVEFSSIITQLFEFISHIYNDFRHLSSSFCHAKQYLSP